MITNNLIKNKNINEIFIKLKTNDDKWFVLDEPSIPYFLELKPYIKPNLPVPFSYDVLTTLRSYYFLIQDTDFKLPQKIIYKKLDIMYQVLTEIVCTKQILVDVFILSLKLKMNDITRIIASFFIEIIYLN